MKRRSRRNRSTEVADAGSAEDHVSSSPAGLHDGSPPVAEPAVTSARPVARRSGSTFDPVDAIRRRWWMPLVAAALGALIALIASTTGPDRYRASAVAAVVPSSIVEATDILRSVDTLEQRTIVATVAELVGTVPTRRDAGLAAADEPGYSMDARVIPNTNLVRITVEGNESARVSSIASQAPQVLSRQLREMFRVYDVRTVSEASATAEKVDSEAGRNALAGGLAGFILGALAALVLHLTSRTLR